MLVLDNVLAIAALVFTVFGYVKDNKKLMLLAVISCVLTFTASDFITGFIKGYYGV